MLSFMTKPEVSARDITMRRLAFKIAESIAFLLVIPLLLWSRLPLPEVSTFTAPSQLLALVPGNVGILLRRTWYRLTLKRCGCNLTVDWLGVVRTRDSEIGDRCTLGVAAWVGWVKIGNDVLTGNGLTILSGASQHNFSDLGRPMREQTGTKRQVVIGDDVWIGSNVTVLASIASGTVVGAGSVVTRSFEPCVIIAGNPARILRQRASSGSEASVSANSRG
jgi:virginiamycin A acetyltransferase